MTLRIFLAAAMLALAAFPWETQAQAQPRSECRAPDELIRLDQPLPRVAAKLRAREPLTIVAIGSSSTAGYGASTPANNYPSRLAAELAKRLPGQPIRVFNKGVGGETSDQMVARFDRDVFAHRPDLVIWQVGTNSVIKDADLGNYEQIVLAGMNRLKAAGSDIIVMDMQYAPKVLDHPHWPQMEAIIADATAREKVPVFHRFDLMKHWVASGQLPFPRMLSADGLHMNDLSYRCLAKALAKSIVERGRPAESAPIASRR
jgi:acyl-CoA thioesterase-1